MPYLFSFLICNVWGGWIPILKAPWAANGWIRQPRREYLPFHLNFNLSLISSIRPTAPSSRNATILYSCFGTLYHASLTDCTLDNNRFAFSLVLLQHVNLDFPTLIYFIPHSTLQYFFFQFSFPFLFCVPGGFVLFCSAWFPYPAQCHTPEKKKRVIWIPHSIKQCSSLQHPCNFSLLLWELQTDAPRQDEKWPGNDLVGGLTMYMVSSCMKDRAGMSSQKSPRAANYQA